MLVAISGTPGTGKTSLCPLLEKEGWAVFTVEALAEEHGCVAGLDEAADSKLVDIELLAGKVKDVDLPEKTIVEGHLSHRLPVDIAVILRCNPKTLRERLSDRGYLEEKLRENLEAEGVDVILVEAVKALGKDKVYEVDTTYMNPVEAAAAVSEALEGNGERYRPGSVDWSQEVMDWY